MSEIRILTVRQPWAWAIIHGGKDVENRVRNIAGDYRGTVAIHAAVANHKFAPDETDRIPEALHQMMRDNREIVKEFEAWPWYQNRGLILGTVDLVGEHWSGMECSRGVTCHEYELCSPWSEAYVHHLVLRNPRPLRTPLPFKGALGLRRFDSTLLDGGFR